jgi:hypothetical protein
MAATFNPQAAADQARNAYRSVTILILIFAVGFMAPAFAGETAPKTQAACEKAGMDWDATASAPAVKCHFRFA